jgi:hypothetical protein
VAAITNGGIMTFPPHHVPVCTGVPPMSGLVVTLLLIGGFLLIALTVRAIQRH